MTEFYVKGNHTGIEGNKDTFWNVQVEHKEKPLPHHDQGLSYTATGYGSKIPTRYMVKWYGRWYRVYCMVYSNSGTCYINTNDGRLTVDQY